MSGKLTLHEVKLAFTLGTQGAFGVFHNTNVGTLKSWLKGYRNCDSRRAVLDALNQRSVKPSLKGRERLMRGLTDLGYARLVSSLTSAENASKIIRLLSSMKS